MTESKNIALLREIHQTAIDSRDAVGELQNQLTNSHNGLQKEIHEVGKKVERLDERVSNIRSRQDSMEDDQDGFQKQLSRIWDKVMALWTEHRNVKWLIRGIYLSIIAGLIKFIKS